MYAGPGAVRYSLIVLCTLYTNYFASRLHNVTRPVSVLYMPA